MKSYLSSLNTIAHRAYVYDPSILVATTYYRDTYSLRPTKKTKFSLEKMNKKFKFYQIYIINNIKLFMKYIFVINLFRNINIDTIF